MQRVPVGFRSDPSDVCFAFLGEGRHDLVFLQEPLDADDDTRPTRHHPLEDTTRHTLFGDELLIRTTKQQPRLHSPLTCSESCSVHSLR